jgi:hypothetical protein
MRADFSNAKDSTGSRASAFNLNAAGKDQSVSRFNDGGAAIADRSAGVATLQAVTFAPEEELERWDGMG